MKLTHLLPAALLALPLAAAAQTTPATHEVTTVTEDLDPNTGKVIRRTTRTTTEPVGTPAPSEAAVAPATDAQVASFLGQKTTTAAPTPTGLLATYGRFIDKVRTDRATWKPADWNTAAAVLSNLNARYEQLRPSFSLDDKVTIRTQQAEFQALRLGQQVSKQLSDKL